MGLANIIKININGQFKFIGSQPFTVDSVLQTRELAQLDAILLVSRGLGSAGICH